MHLDGCVESRPDVMADPLLSTRRPASITVAIDPVSLVVTECITVTSAMRKHARWAHSSVSAILGGSSARLPPADTRSNHDRSSRSAINLVDDDGAITSRWGLRGKKGQSMQDNPLMSAFAKLRSDLKGCKGMLGPYIFTLRRQSC